MDLHGAALGALGGALLAWLARRDGGTQLAAAILLPVGLGYLLVNPLLQRRVDPHCCGYVLRREVSISARSLINSRTTEE
jgi:hypothetical protein